MEGVARGDSCRSGGILILFLVRIFKSTVSTRFFIPLTAAVKAAFPKGNIYVDLHEELGAIYHDDLFADFYANRGHPVEVSPWRLAMATIMQYMEGLTDRQTADAVRRCMDGLVPVANG